MAPPLPEVRKGSPQPLVSQIDAHFREAILEGSLRPGERLPTIRAVAAHAGITRTTVQQAYRRLAAAGLVTAMVGRGTTVTRGASPEVAGPFSRGADAAWRHLEAAPQGPYLAEHVATVANFSQLQPDQELFPVDEFRACVGRILRQRGGDLLEYGEPGGLPELRRCLAARDPRQPTDPAELLVTSGAQQGIDLVLRTFTSPGDAVALTVPTYHHLFGLLRAHGLELVPLRVKENGIEPEDLEAVLSRPRVRLLYVMPTFHNPTGRTMNAAARRTLMRVVEKSSVPVLEDEFEKDLRFSGGELPSLRSLDARGLTVTVHTFSKGLFPGVRIGWLLASAEVFSRMAALKRFTDLETSPLLQGALADFLGRGAFDRYLARLRAELGRRHRAAQKALHEHMPAGSSWSEPEGGFALWVEAPPSVDGDRLADLAATKGVLVTPGRVFDPLMRPGPGMRLSLSRTPVAAVRRGIRILGQCAGELLARAHPSRRPLFL